MPSQTTQSSTMIPRPPIVFYIITLFALIFPNKISCSFIISNNCPFPIWPGILAGAGTPELSTTGFELGSGMSVKISSTPGWSGRMWGRTGCQFDKTGTGTCLTGDCGGRLECKGSGATPPASLFEITLGKGMTDKDFYDVSLVDGYNLPIVAWPLGVNGGQCNATGCISDINIGCPKELQVVGNNGDGEVGSASGNGVVACKSACETFGTDEFCCSGEYANPNTCKPSSYSIMFKKACPRAYSYAFDDTTSTFTCKANDYAILFCPSANRAKKPAGAHSSSPPPPPTYSYPPPSPAAAIIYTPPISPPPPPPPPPPPYQKHGSGASVGEVSSSCILQPMSVLILWLATFSLLG